MPTPMASQFSHLSQLPLNIQLRDDATLKSFYAGDNEQALNAITEIANGASGEGELFIYLWGNESGKTHLLQAACQAANDQNKSAVYIPLADYQKHDDPNLLLQGVEDINLVCLDDLETVVGHPLWEEALFHFFNQLRAKKGNLVIAANAAPNHLALKLADLKSRLTWGITYQLHRLNDGQKIQALQLRSELRGLQLSTSVGQFLLHRSNRRLVDLFASLEILDKASLAEQRRLTIPFVKQILQL